MPPAHHRVVDAARDWTLPDQKCVGNSREALERVVVLVCNRFAGAVAVLLVPFVRN
jgi:hypothetical protein